MTPELDVTTKENVSKFNEDVRQTGSYAYTSERLSARFANGRISKCIGDSFDFKDKTVLDLGCGDGTYTLEFVSFGVKKAVGIDPARVAVESANGKSRKLGLDATVKFEVGNIYALQSYLADNHFDCIVLRGVLHHLPDPARAISGLGNFTGTVIVLEPNGNNPLLKILEKFSRYHIDHEERSFSPSLIRSWLTDTGLHVHSCKVLNLVPFFCPNWMAKGLRIIEPIVEALPLVRVMACGQSIIVAQR